ncbi:MAG: hypothetical protein E6I03_09125 [Chloroflexi bacterium]|nr:MAG: hypothetical protein E6I03_09125 [Chloroflexota bacterium]
MAAHKLLEGGGVALLRGGDERVVLQRSPLAESTPQRSGWFPTASSANAEANKRIPTSWLSRASFGYSIVMPDDSPAIMGACSVIPAR